MLALIRQAEASLVRRRFATSAELIAGLFAALVQWLDNQPLIRNGPFDASPCPNACYRAAHPPSPWPSRASPMARSPPISCWPSPSAWLNHRR